jgi:hypothetical protein
MKNISASQFFGILSLIATVLTVAAAGLQALSPEYALYALGASAAISAFTEKIQGGKPPVIVRDERPTVVYKDRPVSSSSNHPATVNNERKRYDLRDNL